VLDVACGCGQIAILAARAGADVTGIDISPTLLAAARARARQQALDITLELGDAQSLPYDDSAFDVVISMCGAMFAARPHRVASELTRVCRPGGYIAMANWTQAGLFGKMFEILARHARIGHSKASPFRWGDDVVVRERLRSGVESVRTIRRFYPMRFPFPPADVVEFFRLYYGPVNRAFAALDFGGQAKLRGDLDRLWTHYNRDGSGITDVDAEYLEVVAVRADVIAQ
jgi:SAM-dependent methyltransferase